MRHDGLPDCRCSHEIVVKPEGSLSFVEVLAWQIRRKEGGGPTFTGSASIAPPSRSTSAPIPTLLWELFGVSAVPC